MDDQTPVKPNKTTVRMMIILIILLLVGIATRWKYIEKEIVDVTRGMFNKEAPAADSLQRK